MKQFRRAVALLLMASTLATMAGCSFTSEGTDSTEETTQATYLVGSPGKAETFEFGVTGINSFDVVTDYGETMHYLLVSVSYTNLSEKEQDISKEQLLPLQHKCQEAPVYLCRYSFSSNRPERRKLHLPLNREHRL